LFPEISYCLFVVQIYHRNDAGKTRILRLMASGTGRPEPGRLFAWPVASHTAAGTAILKGMCLFDARHSGVQGRYLFKKLISRNIYRTNTKQLLTNRQNL